MRSSDLNELLALRSGSPYFLNENCLTPNGSWYSNNNNNNNRSSVKRGSGRQRASSNPILPSSACDATELPLSWNGRSRSIATAETDSSGSFDTTQYHSWVPQQRHQANYNSAQQNTSDSCNKNNSNNINSSNNNSFYQANNSKNVAFWEETHHQTRL